QRIYLRAAQQTERAAEPERAWLLKEWENVLNDLERDFSLTRDRIDWVAKKFLLNALQEEERLAWSDPWLQAIDLEYHNVSPDEGLFYELLRQGSMRRIVEEDDVKSAIFAPPETTRAYFRGRSVAKFNSAITSIQWDEIVFANDGREQRVALPEVSQHDARLAQLNTLFRREADLSAILAAGTNDAGQVC
ncbi:MAG: proteasome accessory factor PafA2 family protein, partial [Verrucomicrobiota bacterium]|nr:proteasome accessory factor PafA2 family protein [Verrucomicrobiota bacterium]